MISNIEKECKKGHGIHTKWSLCYNSLGSKYYVCMICQNERSKEYSKNNRLKILLRNAKLRKKEIDIDLEFLTNLLIKQNNKCALSGIEFSEKHNYSLDRIDSNKGYTKDNVQFILWDINRMKSDLNQNEFIELCKKVSSCGNNNK